MTALALAAPVPAPPRRELTLEVPAMGGRLRLHVAVASPRSDASEAALHRVARRVGRWADRLTRFDARSALAALNRDPSRPATSIGPTLTAVLDWAERAVDRCDGWLDVTLLDERLAAESGASVTVPPVSRPVRWWLERGRRGGIVHRREPLRFDLDGIAKGWIADRALALLDAFPAAMVDADGDIALRPDAGTDWLVGVADPRPGAVGDLAHLRLEGRWMAGAVGIATSGTSVHRWPDGPSGEPRHHLIDPATGRPARTDVVQATVIAGTAREAEILAKTATIAGSEAGLAVLEAREVAGAILLLASGEVIALPRTQEWLA